MQIERSIKVTGARVFLILLAGALVAMTLVSVGQQSSEGSYTSEDKTFALAQHPNIGAPTPTTRYTVNRQPKWLPFDFRHKLHAGPTLYGITVWDGRHCEKRALISVWCAEGFVEVQWEGEVVRLDATGTAGKYGMTATFYTTHLTIARPGDMGSWGEYAITVDIAD